MLVPPTTVAKEPDPEWRHWRDDDMANDIIVMSNKHADLMWRAAPLNRRNRNIAAIVHLVCLLTIVPLWIFGASIVSVTLTLLGVFAGVQALRYNEKRSCNFKEADVLAQLIRGVHLSD